MDEEAKAVKRGPRQPSYSALPEFLRKEVAKAPEAKRKGLARSRSFEGKVEEALKGLEEEAQGRGSVRADDGKKPKGGERDSSRGKPMISEGGQKSFEGSRQLSGELLKRDLSGSAEAKTGRAMRLSSSGQEGAYVGSIDRIIALRQVLNFRDFCLSRKMRYVNLSRTKIGNILDDADLVSFVKHLILSPHSCLRILDLSDAGLTDGFMEGLVKALEDELNQSTIVRGMSAEGGTQGGNELHRAFIRESVMEEEDLIKSFEKKHNEILSRFDWDTFVRTHHRRKSIRQSVWPPEYLLSKMEGGKRGGVRLSGVALQRLVLDFNRGIRSMPAAFRLFELLGDNCSSFEFLSLVGVGFSNDETKVMDFQAKVKILDFELLKKVRLSAPMSLYHQLQQALVDLSALPDAPAAAEVEAERNRIQSDWNRIVADMRTKSVRERRKKREDQLVSLVKKVAEVENRNMATGRRPGAPEGGETETAPANLRKNSKAYASNLNDLKSSMIHTIQRRIVRHKLNALPQLVYPTYRLEKKDVDKMTALASSRIAGSTSDMVPGPERTSAELPTPEGWYSMLEELALWKADPNCRVVDFSGCLFDEDHYLQAVTTIANMTSSESVDRVEQENLPMIQSKQGGSPEGGGGGAAHQKSKHFAHPLWGLYLVNCGIDEMHMKALDLIARGTPIKSNLIDLSVNRIAVPNDELRDCFYNFLSIVDPEICILDANWFADSSNLAEIILELTKGTRLKIVSVQLCACAETFGSYLCQILSKPPSLEGDPTGFGRRYSRSAGSKSMETSKTKPSLDSRPSISIGESAGLRRAAQNFGESFATSELLCLDLRYNAIPHDVLFELAQLLIARFPKFQKFRIAKNIVWDDPHDVQIRSHFASRISKLELAGRRGSKLPGGSRDRSISHVVDFGDPFDVCEDVDFLRC